MLVKRPEQAGAPTFLSALRTDRFDRIWPYEGSCTPWGIPWPSPGATLWTAQALGPIPGFDDDRYSERWDQTPRIRRRRATQAGRVDAGSYPMRLVPSAQPRTRHAASIAWYMPAPFPADARTGPCRQHCPKNCPLAGGRPCPRAEPRYQLTSNPGTAMTCPSANCAVAPLA